MSAPIDWANAPALAVALTRLDLRPGDVVVVKLNALLRTEDIERLSGDLQRNFPNNKAIVLDKRADLSVVRSEALAGETR